MLEKEKTISIPLYYDNEDKKYKSSNQFFSSYSPEVVGEHRTRNEALKLLNSSGKFICPECRETLYPKLSTTPHLSHYPIQVGTPNCDLRKGESFTKPSEIYSGEGELHLFWKLKIAEYLSLTSGVSNLAIEEDVITVLDDGSRTRKRPDIHFKYDDLNFAFEVQNSWLSPAAIIERERYYFEKGKVENTEWKIVWLLTPSLNNTTKIDLQNNRLSSSFICLLDEGLLNKWVEEQCFSLSCEIRSFKSFDMIKKLIPSKVTVFYYLDDCHDLYEDKLPKGSISYIKQEEMLSFCRAITPPICPRNVYDDGHVEALQMKHHLRYNLGLQINEGEPSVSIQKLFRFMAGIAINGVLFSHKGTDNEFLDYRLNTQKWNKFMPLFVATAVSYNSPLLTENISLASYAEGIKNNDIDDIDDVFSCAGKKWQELRKFFPLIEQRFLGYSLSEVLGDCYD